MTRRWIGLAASGIAGTLVLTGCGSPAIGGSADGSSNDTASPGTASDKPVVLRMVAADYGPAGAQAIGDPSGAASGSPAAGSPAAARPGVNSGATKAYWDSVITGFERKHPGITVDLQVLPWQEVEQKIQVMTKANQVPDLLQADGFSSLAASGQLYRTQEVLSGGLRENLLAPLSTAGRYDGVEYGIPFAARPRRLVYNKALLEQAGASAPKTWKQLADAAEKLKADKVPVPYGMALSPQDEQTGGASRDGATAEAVQWMLGNGAPLMNESGKVSIGGEREADALSWVRTHLVDTGLTAADPSKVGTDALVKDFLAGKVGMMSADPTVSARLAAEAAKARQAEQARAAKTAGKNQRLDQKPAGLDYGVARMPGRRAPLVKPLTTTDWMVAFRKNGHQQQIREFLDYAYAPAQQAALTAALGLLPTTEDGRSAVGADQRFAMLKPWLSALKNSKSTTYPVGAPAWAAVADGIRKNAGKAVTGDKKQAETVIDKLRESVVEQQQNE